MKKILLSLPLLILSINSITQELPEMVIGKASSGPGIDYIFEGAIKDDVSPVGFFLAEDQSDIHIEVLANWNDESPRGSVVGGFVAYLDIKTTITNQKTNQSKSVILKPHLNMSDNLHYAQNLKLPGSTKDLYTVSFAINPPREGLIGMHLDWREEVGEEIAVTSVFTFTDLDFYKISQATRR